MVTNTFDNVISKVIQNNVGIYTKENHRSQTIKYCKPDERARQVTIYDGKKHELTISLLFQGTDLLCPKPAQAFQLLCLLHSYISFIWILCNNIFLTRTFYKCTRYIYGKFKFTMSTCAVCTFKEYFIFSTVLKYANK